MINALDLVLNNQWAMQEEALKRFLELAETRGGHFDRDQLPAWCTWAERAQETAITLQSGGKLDGTRKVMVRDGVAVIPVLGPIFRRANLFSEFSGGCSLDLLAKDLVAAVNSDAVKSILLEIDSPGGAVSGTSEMAAHIVAMNRKKPICAYIGGTGASAAYWLAAACGGIVANPTAIVGSIGVLGAYQKDDEETITIVSSQSPRKRPDLETAEGRADVLQTLDALAAVFVADVAKYRGVSEKTVLNDFGAGGVLVGKATVSAGMVDRLGSLESTIRELAKDPGTLTSRRKRTEADGDHAAEGCMDDTILGAAPAAKPFEEELTALLAGVRGSIDRARDIQSKRLEEGRSLSAARRDQLAAVRDELNTLLREIEPRASEADRLRLAAEAQAIEAAMLAASLLGASI